MGNPSVREGGPEVSGRRSIIPDTVDFDRLRSDGARNVRWSILDALDPPQKKDESEAK